MLRIFVILFLSFTSSLHSQDTHIDNHVEDILLSEFFEDAFKKMGVPQNFKVDGLSNAKKIQVSFLNKINDDNLIYQLNNKNFKTKFAVIPLKNSNEYIVFIELSNISLYDIVKELKGTPLGILGNLPSINFIIAPKQINNFSLASSIPSSLSKSLSRDNKRFTLFQGLNFIADLKLSSAPNNLKSIFSSLNISSNFTLPLRGKVPNNFFKNIFPLKKPTSHNDNLLKNAKLENIYKQLNRKFSRNFIQDININATLPKSINFQGLSINDSSFLIKGTKDNQLSFGINASKVDLHDLTLENILVSYDAEKKQTIANGSVADSEANKKFTYKGLSLKKISLNALHEKNKWEFKLEGIADINGKEVDYYIDIKDEANKVEYVATLDAQSGGGISAKDVAGRSVPGLDEIKLDKITVTNDQLVADLEFLKTKGEIAAFHPQGFDKAVMAVTLDKLGFSELIPGTSGTPLDGVSIDNLTIMLVPESKSKNFNAEDKSIPKHIQDNILKVLNDAKKDSKALPNGINLFSELDFKASGDMKDLMSFIGMDSELIVPLSGSISPNIFNTKASFKEKYTGTSLNVPMPKIKLPSMPGSFKFIAPEFHITDKSPSGKEELWTGILTGINGDLLGQKINFNSNIGFSDDEISLNADSAMQLPSPFGIKWLTLKDLGLNIDYDKKNKTGKFEFTATTLKPFGKIQPNISVDLKEEGGKLKAGVLKIKDNISFSDIPIMNKLPHVENFAFTFLDISNTGISGGSILNGLEIDVTVFENAGKWIFAISDDGGGEGFNFSRLIKGLEKTPLGDFHLHDAALVFSEGKLSSPVSSMPEVALPVFKGLYGSDDAMVNISPGITIAANFSPGKSSGSAKDGLSGIGIANDILIEGSLNNIFGGKGMPSIKILVQTEQGPSSGKASHSPKMLNFPGSVGFFIELEEESFEVGLQSDVVLDLPKKQKLDLISRLELGINEKGFNIDIFLDLKGNWNEPFGIPGLDLEEVALKFGIDDIGEVTFGFKGTSEIAETKVDLAAEMSFLLEAEGLPDGVAIKGEIEDLNIPHLIELAETMAGGDAKALFGDNIPLPEFKDVAFAFATPGMSDPDLGLVDSGFLMKGKCFLLGQELGSTLVSVGPSGIKLDDEIADIDLKILKLKNNVMKLNVGFTAPPSFLISSDFDFLGVTQKADVSFNDGIYEMTIVDKIGNIWESEITFGFGFDPDAQGVPDIFIEGLIKEDMFDYLKTQAPKKVEEYFSVLDDGYKAAVQKINGAKAKVRSIDGRIQREKEKIQRARNNAESAVRNAENRVRQLQNNANGARSAYESNRHRCGWRHPSACVREGWYWGKWRGEQAAANAAMAVLRSVQSTLQHLPSELMDPTLIGLETERATAMTALNLAEAIIVGFEDMNNWMSSGLQTLTKEVGSSEALVLKEVFFEGDLEGMLHGAPMILTIDLEVFGKDLGKQEFAFKLDDPVFDAEQLVFIPLHMIYELFNQYVPSGLKKIIGPVLAKINEESQKVEEQVHAELSKIPSMNMKSLDDIKNSISLANNKIILAKNNLNFKDTQFDFVNSNLILAQNSTTDDAKPKKSNVNNKSEKKSLTLKEKINNYKKKREKLLDNVIMRNKAFGEAFAEFTSKSLDERQKLENDLFVPYTDIHIPPSELFTEKLLVARHSKLCLGQNASGKITFHACNENTGGLLWATKKVLVDPQTSKVRIYDEKFAKQHPNLLYTQILHNGMCLTTPFHLQSFDENSIQVHTAKLEAISKKGANNIDAQLKLESCRPDAHGQLWKVIKATHSNQNDSHGFALRERDSGYCLRPDVVKAHTKKEVSKEVNAVFYPCSGVAHSIFEIQTPSGDLPVWYDHNGVIKSDNGFCLDVPNDPKSNSNRGSIVFLQKCVDDEYDRWDYVVDYDKTVKIINDFTGNCLYPYKKDEGVISNAQENQLVQRPCDARFGQGWSMKVIPNSKFFQLEAIDSDKKLTGQCMIPDKYTPEASSTVNIMVQSCNPANRGRWEFGHWKGNFQWTEWTEQNFGETSTGANDLSKIYWISQDSIADKNSNGVCRVLIGDHTSGNNYSIFPGTWSGENETCNYIDQSRIVSLDPAKITDSETYIEVLTGLSVGSGGVGNWLNSSSAVPHATPIPNTQPPQLNYTPFLAGGSEKEPHLYLCRVKDNSDKNWYYGYQADGKKCLAPSKNYTSSEIIVFKVVNNN